MSSFDQKKSKRKLNVPLWVSESVSGHDYHKYREAELLKT